jgi:hypothetical protein
MSDQAARLVKEDNLQLKEELHAGEEDSSPEREGV